MIFDLFFAKDHQTMLNIMVPRVELRILPRGRSHVIKQLESRGLMTSEGDRHVTSEGDRHVVSVRDLQLYCDAKTRLCESAVKITVIYKLKSS